MSILDLFITLVIIGLIVWVVTSIVPMDARIKNVIVVVAVFVCILVAIEALFGLPGWVHTRLR